MTYRFDPELAPFAPRMAPLDYGAPVDARNALRAVMAAQPRYEPAEPVLVEDRTIPGHDGSPAVPVRLYRPADRPGRLPALVFPHWGGFVTGDLDTATTQATRIAELVGALVVSPDYRLAPEHPFPAALDDCYATLVWVARQAHDLGVDPARVGVGGLSAGGGLAAALALLARDQGGPPVRHQFLLFPELDDRVGTASARAFTDTPMLDRANLLLSWKHYLSGWSGAGVGAVSRYAAPARAEDLRGLPPAFVGVCEFDPLRDEGIDYALRLIAAGVPTDLVHYPGTFHASIGIAHAAVSRRMVADQIAVLRRELAVG
ncbi:alpha/beta hydrolase [Saccharothrix syringae]|uniref:Alpha/beta hydrolase n=1 Tax=Saccharothrix syringae TaxID=103733 RepID=A0A5Q0GXX5_SACSY|nr:alpha/beta hydrolase [Saccharothrix syringae]QFZ18811.1 alpha/beta hydrolase [Saccharothrix syringae]